MKWYDIPQIKVEKLYNEQKNTRGVLIKAKDFERLVEKMEDFYDIIAVEKVMRSKNQKVYTLEEVTARLEGIKT